MFLNDNETVVDLIQYEPVARSVVGLLDKARGTPITVGVHGDWGAGKSSVLAMVQRQLAGDDRTLCLRFNGWTFQGFDDAKLVMLEAIVAEVRDARSGSAKLAEQAQRLFKRIDWLKVAKHAGGIGFTVATGVPLPEHATAAWTFVQKLAEGGKPVDGVPAGVIEEAKGLLKPDEGQKSNVPTEIQSFRADFEKLLKEAGVERLVVLVDDLDRCLPRTIIETLEAIRLFLFVDQSAFIIAVDEAMVEYAVRQHFPDLPGGIAAGGYARNYLEKLIQVPFRIPALGPAETKTYIALLLLQPALSPGEFEQFVGIARKKMARPWASDGLTSQDAKDIAVQNKGAVEQAFRLSGQLARLLNDGTNGNPRQVKRFLNSLLLRESIAAARGFSDAILRPELAKIMLLERFAPAQYLEVVKSAGSAPDGLVTGLAVFEQAVRDGKTDVEDSGPFAAWLKEAVVMDWLKLDPVIGKLDLRPYLFVTRDKRAFSGMGSTVEHLRPLIDKLCAGAFSAARESDTIAKLGAADARAVFAELAERIGARDRWQTRPDEMDGLAHLVKAHASLQDDLIELLRGKPVKALGAWAPSGWDGFITAASATGNFRRLLTEWAAQSENTALQKAAASKLKR